nr:MAG TPA: hypothetical protein [Caudoviricetes sp.]
MLWERSMTLSPFPSAFGSAEMVPEGGGMTLSISPSA